MGNGFGIGSGDPSGGVGFGLDTTSLSTDFNFSDALSGDPFTFTDSLNTLGNLGTFDTDLLLTSEVGDFDTGFDVDAFVGTQTDANNLLLPSGIDIGTGDSLATDALLTQDLSTLSLDADTLTSLQGAGVNTLSDLQNQDNSLLPRVGRVFGLGPSLDEHAAQIAAQLGRDVDDPVVQNAAMARLTQQDQRLATSVFTVASLVFTAAQSAAARSEAADAREEERDFAREQSERNFQQSLALQAARRSGGGGGGGSPGGAVRRPSV